MKILFKKMIISAILAIMAAALGGVCEKTYASDYESVDTSNLSSEEQYWAGRTGSQHQNTLYYLMDGCLKSYTVKQAKKGADPLVYADGVKQDIWDSSRVFIQGNLMLYVTQDNCLHLSNLKKKTDEVIKENVDKIVDFRGKRIAIKAVGAKKVTFITTKGKNSKAPEWGKIYTEKLMKNYYRLGDDLYNLDLHKKKGLSTLYLVTDEGPEASGTLDLTYLHRAEEYDIHCEGGYLYVNSMDEYYDHIRIYDTECNLVFDEGYDIEWESYKLVIAGDKLYRYREIWDEEVKVEYDVIDLAK